MTKQQLENNFNGLCAAMLNLYQRNPNSKIARRFIAACKTGEAELAVQILLNLWNEIPDDVREEVLNYHLDQQSNSTSYEDELVADTSNYEGEWQPYRSNNRL